MKHLLHLPGYYYTDAVVFAFRRHAPNQVFTIVPLNFLIPDGRLFPVVALGPFCAEI
jgi:hypothetical protein